MYTKGIVNNVIEQPRHKHSLDTSCSAAFTYSFAHSCVGSVMWPCFIFSLMGNIGAYMDLANMNVKVVQKSCEELVSTYF